MLNVVFQYPHSGAVKIYNRLDSLNVVFTDDEDYLRSFCAYAGDDVDVFIFCKHFKKFEFEGENGDEF